MAAVVSGEDLMQQSGSALLTDKDDDLEYDLGNLVAMDTTTDVKKAGGSELDMIARENTQLLMNRLFSLPSRVVPGGRIIELPAGSMRIPREKPVPKPKAPTTWEKFAKIKGIHKKKSGRMVWDEMEETWKPKWGYKAANDETKQWAIEHKDGEDGGVDPWTRMKQDKKERVQANKDKQLKNLKAAAGNRLPGTLDLASLAPKKGKKRKQAEAPNDTHVDVALATVQKSTASMGKHDKLRRGEAKPKHVDMERKKKKIFTDIGTEKQQTLSLLSKIPGMGNKEAERFDSVKAARKAQAATDNQRMVEKQSSGSARGRGGKRGGRGGSRGGGRGRR